MSLITIYNFKKNYILIIYNYNDLLLGFENISRSHEVNFYSTADISKARRTPSDLIKLNRSEGLSDRSRGRHVYALI